MSPHALVGQVSVGQVSVGQMSVGQVSRIQLFGLEAQICQPPLQLLPQLSRSYPPRPDKALPCLSLVPHTTQTIVFCWVQPHLAPI